MGQKLIINDPIHILMCDAYYNPSFYGAFDEDVFISIITHQDGLKLRERHPGGVKQEKLDFMFMMYDTS